MFWSLEEWQGKKEERRIRKKENVYVCGGEKKREKKERNAMCGG